MSWQPPAGVTPLDRRNPNTANEADLPDMLDWLKGKYPGNTVVGLMVTARDTGTTYRVESNARPYTLTPLATPSYVDQARGRLIDRRYFGIHIDTRSNPNWYPTVGYGSYRAWDTGTHWRQIETAKGVYDWARLDAIVTQAAVQGFEVMFTLGQAPDFATATAGSGSYNAAPPTNQDWTDFLTALAVRNRDRYGGRITAYEVWNEPNLAGFWNGTPARLVELTRLARTTLKAINPAALIVSPCPTGDQGGNGPQYLGQLLAAGLAPEVDVIGVHLYNAPNPPEQQLTVVQQYRAVLAQYGASDKPIWNTECTWPSYYDVTTGAFQRNQNGATAPAMSHAQAAAYLQRLYLINAVAGVERTFFYGTGPLGTFTKLPFANQADLSQLAPAGLGLQALITQLVGKRLAAFTRSGPQYTATFEDVAGERITYAWTADAAPSTLDVSALGATRARRLDAPAASVGRLVRLDETPTALTRDTPRAALPGLAAPAPTIGAEMLYNGNFRLRAGTASQPLPGWDAVGVAVADYAGLNRPPGGTPITLTPGGQYTLLRTFLPALPRGRSYSLEVDYSLPATQAGEWQLRLEYGPLGNTFLPGSSSALPGTAPGEWATLSLPMDYPLYRVPAPDSLRV
ncbi:GH39 family glycosyl hydrolase, partial [Deinococcus aetherius]